MGGIAHITLTMWEPIDAYPWRYVAFLGGDFNNSPMPRDKITQRSHMLQVEKRKWAHLMAHSQAGDVWVTLQHDMYLRIIIMQSTIIGQD